MSAPRLVLIPGMGADHRLFDNLGLRDLDTLRPDWIPHREGEDLAAYAARFCAHHAMLSSDVLVGVSMGGIVAGSIAQTLCPRRLILISSCTDIRQLSPFIAALSPFGPISPFEITRLLPRGLLPAYRKLALTMFEEQDMAFIRWACGAVMRWPGVARLPGTTSIHGTADRVFPVRRQPQVDVAIVGGGHLMIMDRAGEVAAAIRTSLAC